MMMMNSIFAVCVLLAILADVKGDMEHYNYDIRSPPKKFCGKILADTLHIVCNGNYNGHMNKKSGNPEESYNDEDYVNFEQQLDEPMFPFRSRASAMRIIPQKFRRTVRGITNECCEKSCTFHELRSYCANPTNAPERRSYYPY